MPSFSRATHLTGAALASWLVALANAGDIPTAVAFGSALACGYSAIRESKALIFHEAHSKAVDVMEQELAITQLELVAESRVAALQQEYSPEARQELEEALNYLYYNAEPSEPGGSEQEPPQENDSSDFTPRFTRFNLPAGSAKEFIENCRTELGLNQTQLIEMLWGVKKGGGQGWSIAHKQYKEIMGEG